MESPLLQSLSDGVLTLTLNRPERRNALSPELVSELLDVIGSTQQDDTVRAIVLTGAGERFCAGGDLSAGGLAGDGVLGRHASGTAFADVLRAILNSKTPVIAAVNGDALGGGLGLVAACHMVFSAPSARFGTPELKLGLFPMMIGPLLARVIPRQVLYEMILLDERLTAARAHAVGLVTRVSGAGEELADAQRAAETIANRSSAVVGLGLRALATTSDMCVDDALEHMNAQLTLNLLTEDAAEGITAFLMRRPPEWKGR